MFGQILQSANLQVELTGINAVIEFLAEAVEICGVVVILIGLSSSIFRYIRGTGSICFGVQF